MPGKVECDMQPAAGKIVAFLGYPSFSVEISSITRIKACLGFIFFTAICGDPLIYVVTEVIAKTPKNEAEVLRLPGWTDAGCHGLQLLA